MPDGSMAQWENSFLLSGLRFAAHSKNLNGWNIYGGLSAGYSQSTIDASVDKKSNNDLSSNNGKLLLTGFVGTRYRSTPHIGMYTELGLGVSLVKLGISTRIW